MIFVSFASAVAKQISNLHLAFIRFFTSIPGRTVLIRITLKGKKARNLLFALPFGIFGVFHFDRFQKRRCYSIFVELNHKIVLFVKKICGKK